MNIVRECKHKIWLGCIIDIEPKTIEDWLYNPIDVLMSPQNVLSNTIKEIVNLLVSTYHVNPMVMGNVILG